MLKDLFEYTVFIDAEGRCDNYTLHGYVAADNRFEAEYYIYKTFTNQGENVITVKITPMYSLVDIAQ